MHSEVMLVGLLMDVNSMTRRPDACQSLRSKGTLNASKDSTDRVALRHTSSDVTDILSVLTHYGTPCNGVRIGNLKVLSAAAEIPVLYGT